MYFIFREDQGDLCVSPSLDSTRALSPRSLELKLDEKFKSFERSIEVAVKYMKDLELSWSGLKRDYEVCLHKLS